MSSTIPILLYHSVSDTPHGEFGPYTVSVAQLASHLDLVLERGYTPITIGQLLDQTQHGPIPARPVVLTFDDGFSDFAENAWPVLTRRGLSATLYVTAGCLGGRSEWLTAAKVRLPMLSGQQLRDLAVDGCEIGAHSMTHPQLDCLPSHSAYAEIRNSKDVLEQELGACVDDFAYPHGYHSRTTKDLVRAAGYRSAAAVRNALSYDNDDRFALARVTVTSDYSTTDLQRALSGDTVSVARPREKWRTTAWRQARRLKRASRSVRATGTWKTGDRR